MCGNGFMNLLGFASQTLLFQIGNNPLTTTGAMDLVMAVSGDDSRVRLLDMIVCNTFIHKLTKCLLMVQDFLGQDLEFLQLIQLRKAKFHHFFHKICCCIRTKDNLANMI